MVSTPIVRLPCIHCGIETDVHSGTAPEKVFCCNGCRGAYDLIQGWGLDNFYALRDQLADESNHSVRDAGRDFRRFDSEEYLGRSAPVVQPGGHVKSKLAIYGLHCGACAWLIENAAQQTFGWISARVRMNDHTIEVLFDPQQTRLGEIAETLGRLGYELAPLTSDPDQSFRAENRKLLQQIATAGFLAANTMWISIALYAADAAAIAHGQWLFLRLIGAMLGVFAILFPGRTFFRGALASLRTRTPHMDLPVALGLSVGTTVGTFNAITGFGEVYFDSMAVLVFLLLIGRWIQFRQQHRAAKAVELMLRLTPRHANRIAIDGQTETVLVDALQIDDTVRVQPGESLPIDGRILSGQTMIDRSLLTGECEPIKATIDDQVSAGTVNLSGTIDVQITAMGSDCRIGKVMELVEKAASNKTPIVQLADRVGGVFVVAITLLSIATFYWWGRSSWMEATEHATALLIVACPCALALATPLALAILIGRSAKRNVLIRDGESVQHLAGSGTIWFDKTGTLTEGSPRILEIQGETSALQHAAAVERQVVHPVARCLVNACTQNGDTLDEHAELQRADNRGVIGTTNGHLVTVGNAAFMRSESLSISGELSLAAQRQEEKGMSPVFIALGDRVCTVLGIVDPLRPDAVTSVDRLRSAGWKIGILSGDAQSVVNKIADKLKVAQHLAMGNLSPEDKLYLVRSSKRSTSRVVMVGDGANDAAALAVADVGIAVRGGAEVSLQAAPIYLAKDSLTLICDLILASRRTKWLIGTTFAVSLSYNLIAVTLAITGRINPLIAAVLMPISSISVLAITLLWPMYGGLMKK